MDGVGTSRTSGGVLYAFSRSRMRLASLSLVLRVLTCRFTLKHNAPRYQPDIPKGGIGVVGGAGEILDGHCFDF